MDAVSGPRRPIEARSGGKIVRQRRVAHRQTPYDRPRLTPPALTESPNWFASATRMFATGAGKILSSVFSPEYSSSSSESSSSGDLSSDDEVASESGQEDIFCQEAEKLHQNGMSSEMIPYFRKDPQPMEGKSATKHLIERLLMQETFSREECDRLIAIIKSRVSHIPIVEKDQDGRSSEIPYAIIGSGLCSSAVMEAKKWLEEKKLGSGSKSELDHGTCSLNSVMLPHSTEGEVGSPVDVAKSYMQLRPPWASPSLNNVEVQTPSPVMIDLFKEETPRSIVGNYLSSSKLKRDSLAAGSWSISEEIRRVRAKASEDLLGSLPSSKIDWSTFSLEHKSRPNFLTADTTEMGLETTQDGLRNEALSSNPGIFASEQNQDMEAIRSIEGKQDSGSKEETGLRCTPTANGFPSSGPSLSTGLDAKLDQRPSEGQLSNPVGSSPERISTGVVHGEETCELLSEASVEVPIVNETDNVGSGSQNSSSMQYEELAQNRNAAKSKRKTGGLVDKQGGKKMSRYNRKGRGRGK